MPDNLSKLDAKTRTRRLAFGDTIRVYRRHYGWSQEQLAERAGKDRQSINRYEQGHYSPSLDSVFLLADALGLTPGDLLVEEPPTLPPAPNLEHTRDRRGLRA